MKKNLRRIAVVLLIVAAGAALRFTVFRPKPVPVTVHRAAMGRVEATVVTSRAGTVTSRRRASLSPEIGGRVVELPVRKWDRVRAGDVVVRLADGDYRAQADLEARSLEAARAGVLEACRAAELAAADLERTESLAREKIVSASALDGYRSRRDTSAAACDAAQARVRQAQAAVELARVHLTKTVLRAPFDGILSELAPEVGEWITPSPPGLPIPPVAEILDPGAIYVSAPLDEVDVDKVREGQPARVTMDAFPGRSFPGRVARIAPFVLDTLEQNRTFEVEVTLDDPEFAATLRPGTSADVEVVLDVRESVLRIPAYALLEGNKVLVVREGRLESRAVEPGLKNWEFAEILSGLAPGDAVVVSLDRAEVKEGASVEIAGETGT